MATRKERPLIKEKKQSCGGCSCDHITPRREQLSPETKKINIYLRLEEALMLNVALTEACLTLNRLDRSYSRQDDQITLAVD